MLAADRTFLGCLCQPGYTGALCNERVRVIVSFSPGAQFTASCLQVLIVSTVLCGTIHCCNQTPVVTIIMGICLSYCLQDANVLRFAATFVLSDRIVISCVMVTLDYYYLSGDKSPSTTAAAVFCESTTGANLPRFAGYTTTSDTTTSTTTTRYFQPDLAATTTSNHSSTTTTDHFPNER